MDPLLGFVSVPRLVGSPRLAGAFFSAIVEGPAAPGQWKVHLDGKTVVVASAHNWTPGQVLRLKLVSQEGGRWLFQVVPSKASESREIRNYETLLASAFLSRGLPAVAERLSVWSRWLTKTEGPHDRESWAASLEARGAGPHSPLSEALSPWLAWQKSLEEGHSPPPPEDETCWDEWNLRPTPGDDPWLVVPVRWSYEGQTDAGLLQAHWNPQGQLIDRWHLVAAPVGTPFRLEALVKKDQLHLTWRFFRSKDRAEWESWAQRLEPNAFSTPELGVSLAVAGVEFSPPTSLRRGVDVEA